MSNKKHKNSTRQHPTSFSWLDQRLPNRARLHHNGPCPDSPELALCDFWLNSFIKDRLVEQTNVEALSASITAILALIPKFEYSKTFQTRTERMQLCTKNKGNYFEHIIKKLKPKIVNLIFCALMKLISEHPKHDLIKLDTFDI